MLSLPVFILSCLRSDPPPSPSQSPPSSPLRLCFRPDGRAAPAPTSCTPTRPSGRASSTHPVAPQPPSTVLQTRRSCDAGAGSRAPHQRRCPPLQQRLRRAPRPCRPRPTPPRPDAGLPSPHPTTAASRTVAPPTELASCSPVAATSRANPLRWSLAPPRVEVRLVGHGHRPVPTRLSCRGGELEKREAWRGRGEREMCGAGSAWGNVLVVLASPGDILFSLLVSLSFVEAS
ncbi:hypothetical protein C2845_PM16G17330 [Panicum miliaceum]|uniref:Uncharacterized protein n=1 Tax=Panicum miliaceum TaxID=4540 RepID=A0A3L6PT75_PANMI|nr:hypothetical protein C2845_PM16G17330 [Panicum miliaceum]